MASSFWTLIQEWKRGRPRSPLIETIRNYDADDLRSDLIAGLTVGVVAIPKGMGFALLAGVDPIYGIYASIIGHLFGSLLGSSHHLVTGPTGIVALIVGNMVMDLAQYEPLLVVAYLSIIVGIGHFLLSLIQIGDLARYVSLSVMTGFITGGALVILGDQLTELLAIAIPTSPYFLQRLLNIGLEIFVFHTYHVPTLLVGLVTILLIGFFRFWNRRIPSILISLILMTAVSYLAGFGRYGIELVGEIPRGLPPLIVPEFDPGLASQLIGPGIALLLLSVVQTISISKSIATQSMQSVDQNQELLGQGAANVACGFFGGFPVAGSFSFSFLNHRVGANTQFASVINAGVICIILLTLAPFFQFIPMAVLAGIIIVIAWDIFDWEQIRISLTTTRRDRIVFVSTFLSVLLLRLDTAIFLGFVVSVILFLRKASQIDMKEYFVDAEGNLKTLDSQDERTHPQIGLVDVNGELFFGSAELIKNKIQTMCEESPDLKVILLRMKNAMDLDVTGAKVLGEIDTYLRNKDKILIICGATPGVEEILRESGVAEQLGHDKILVAQRSLLQSTRQAIDRARSYIEDVVEGDVAADEEQPPLKHTLKRIEEEDDHETEEPIEEEKTGYYEGYDEES